MVLTFLTVALTHSVSSGWAATHAPLKLHFLLFPSLHSRICVRALHTVYRPATQSREQRCPDTSGVRDRGGHLLIMQCVLLLAG